MKRIIWIPIVLFASLLVLAIYLLESGVFQYSNYHLSAKHDLSTQMRVVNNVNKTSHGTRAGNSIPEYDIETVKFEPPNVSFQIIWPNGEVEKSDSDSEHLIEVKMSEPQVNMGFLQYFHRKIECEISGKSSKEFEENQKINTGFSSYSLWRKVEFEAEISGKSTFELEGFCTNREAREIIYQEINKFLKRRLEKEFLEYY